MHPPPPPLDSVDPPRLRAPWRRWEGGEASRTLAVACSDSAFWVSQYEGKCNMYSRLSVCMCMCVCHGLWGKGPSDRQY